MFPLNDIVIKSESVKIKAALINESTMKGEKTCTAFNCCKLYLLW